MRSTGIGLRLTYKACQPLLVRVSPAFNPEISARSIRIQSFLEA